MPKTECDAQDDGEDPDDDDDEQEEQSRSEHSGRVPAGRNERAVDRRARGERASVLADGVGTGQYGCMYTTIVVGTDGSDTAAVAWRHAIGLATLSGATLHIVNAYQPVNTVGMALAGVAADVSAIDTELEAHAHDVCAPVAAAAEREGEPCEVHQIPGDPSDSLITIAEHVHADLLVVGNRGMSGVRRVLGSVPNKISHHAPCSVLIVDTR